MSEFDMPSIVTTSSLYASDNIASVSTTAIKNLTSIQFALLDTGQLASLTSDQIAVVDSGDFAALSSDQVAAFTAEQAAGFKANDLKKMLAQVQYLKDEVISGLDTAIIGSLNTKTIVYLSTSQIAA